MADRRAYYVVYAALPDGGIRAAADLGLETDERGRHRYSALRYRSEWLRHPRAFPLNPAQAPLRGDTIEWRTREVPAVIDEVMPGHWERFVLGRMWQQAGHAADSHDLHAILGAARTGFRVGAIEILPADAPAPGLDAPLELADLEQLAADADTVSREHEAELETLQRLQAGSSVGGARPKVIVHDADHAWIAKFTRANDPFNHPRVEHACLELARRAGLEVPASRIVPAGDLDAVLVSRFDVATAGGRHHLVSANAFLKDPDTQADPGHGRYDDLAGLIRMYSEQPAADLRQLYGQMLFNEAINNIDDHLRNFSFLLGEEGFRLSPAYDLVPADIRGAYPNLTMGTMPGRPRPDSRAAGEAARTFQLRPGEAKAVIERLHAAFADLPDVMDAAGLAEPDRRILERVLWRPR